MASGEGLKRTESMHTRDAWSKMREEELETDEAAVSTLRSWVSKNEAHRALCEEILYAEWEKRASECGKSESRARQFATDALHRWMAAASFLSFSGILEPDAGSVAKSVPHPALEAIVGDPVLTRAVVHLLWDRAVAEGWLQDLSRGAAAGYARSGVSVPLPVAYAEHLFTRYLSIVLANRRSGGGAGLGDAAASETLRQESGDGSAAEEAALRRFKASVLWNWVLPPSGPISPECQPQKGPKPPGDGAFDAIIAPMRAARTGASVEDTREEIRRHLELEAKVAKAHASADAVEEGLLHGDVESVGVQHIKDRQAALVKEMIKTPARGADGRSVGRLRPLLMRDADRLGVEEEEGEEEEEGRKPRHLNLKDFQDLENMLDFRQHHGPPAHVLRELDSHDADRPSDGPGLGVKGETRQELEDTLRARMWAEFRTQALLYGGAAVAAGVVIGAAAIIFLGRDRVARVFGRE